MPYGTLNAGTITPGSGNTLTINEIVDGTAIKDEDAMGSNSATHLATQQSIKAYVDTAATQATTAAQGVGTGNDVTHNKLTATTGVLFGTDTAAANTLDDYEEGAFTPTGTALLTTNTGRYTKIGRLVHVYWYTRNNGTIASRLNYAGLPFPAGSTGILTYSTGQMVAYAGGQGGQFLARIAKGTSGVVFTTDQTAAYDPDAAYLEIEFTLTYTID